jgi:myo-inositol 2-dehydrogenase / D-chiro-inositol 1-dehydrogenase
MTHSWQAPRIGVDEKPLRVGAIGCGSHATSTIWPELPLAGFVLDAVCSRDINHATAAAQRFGVARAFSDAEKMLDEVDLDTLVIVVPPDAFAQYVRLAIARQLPAFVEKPGADSPREAGELAAQARKANVEIVVGYQKRFAAASRKAMSLISADDFGQPTLGSFKWAMGPFHQRFDLREWLFENPVHHFDLARFFLGEISELDARVIDSRGEFALVVTGLSSSGALVSIRASTTASWEQRNEEVEIFGLGHSVVVDNVDTCVYRPPEGPELVWRPNYTVPSHANFSGQTLGYGAELAHFRAVVTGEAPAESDLGSAAATLRMAAEIARVVCV